MSHILRSQRFVRLSVYFTLIALGGLLIAGRALVSVTAQGGAPGALDSSFAGVGKLTDAFYRGGRALALQPDGKFVVGGYGDYSSHGQEGDFRLFRLNIDGSLDATFDGDGRASATMGDFANLNDLVIQPDGKIVAVGSASTAGNTDFAVARFNPDGLLDTTFDGDGRLRLNFSEYDEATAVLLQPDGKIVLVGFFANGPHTGATLDFTVVRLNGDGGLDPTFGTGGRVVTDFFGSGDRAFDAALQPDGKIVAAGTTIFDNFFDSAIVRYFGDSTTPPTEPIQVVLSRDGTNQLRATITITNPLPDPVPGVSMTLVRASTLDGSQFVDGVPVPQSFGTINPGQSVTATVTFPGTAGVPSGFAGLVRVNLSYTGGTYTETKQITTP